METKQAKILRAYTYSDLSRKKFKILEFTDVWLEHIGKPECSGAWFICGNSGNGKTSYALQLARYLCQFQRVHYNTLEEGTRVSFKLAMERNNIPAVGSKFSFKSESYENLMLRLSTKRMPKIIIIDSLQYFFRKKNMDDYIALKQRFPKILFIFISHAKGSQPKGDLADAIKYDADVKVFVKDYLATMEASRYGGKEPYMIWQEGYDNAQLKLVRNG